MSRIPPKPKDVKSYREDEDNDECRCSLYRARIAIVPKKNETITCPIHGQHNLWELYEQRERNRESGIPD